MKFALTAITTGAVGASAIYAVKTLEQTERNQSKLLEEQISSTERQTILTQHIHYEQLEDKRSDRALNLISCWDDPRYLNANRTAKRIYEEVKKLNSVSEKEEKIRELFKDSPEYKADITRLLNILEDVALQIHLEMADEVILKKFFRGIFEEYYKTFRCYISDRRREKDNERVFSEFSELCKSWDISNK